jgi:hypothetical protein
MNRTYAALLTSSIALVASISAFAAQAPEPTITVEGTMAPNAYGSPSFDQWAANGITAEENNLSSFGSAGPTQFNVVTSALPESENWVTGFPSWLGQADPGTVFGPAYANELGTRASFAAVITAAPDSTISIDGLGFTMSSSDPGNGLGWSWGVGTWDYDATDIGIINNPDGSYTIVNSGPADQQVNEIISIGAGNAYASYNDPYGPSSWNDDPNPGATNQQIIDYDLAELGFSGYDFTGTFTYGGSSGSATIDFTSVPDAASTLGLLGLAFSVLALVRRKLS